MAGVRLQAGVFAVEGRAPTLRRAPVQQVALQAAEQGVVLGRVVGQVFGVRVALDFARGTHDFMAAKHRHEVAAGRAPCGAQRVVVFLRIRVGAQAPRVVRQVAPVAARRRRHIEMQRARARLRGDHAQHVRRNVERGEGEQTHRQAGG